MTDSTADADLAAALAALTEPHKTGKVAAGQRRYTYLMLPDLMGHARAILAQHAIAIHQTAQTVDGRIQVETLLRHHDGTVWFSGPLTAAQPSDPQQLGSLLTYLRRYSAATFLGLSGDDDDDGQAAARANPPQHRTPPSLTADIVRDTAGGLTTIDELRALWKAADNAGVMDDDLRGDLEHLAQQLASNIPPPAQEDA